MLAPEDDDLCPLKGDILPLPRVEGILPDAVAGTQPVHEPVRMEGRDIRSPAGGDDQRGYGCLPAVRGLDDGFRPFHS